MDRLDTRTDYENQSLLTESLQLEAFVMTNPCTLYKLGNKQGRGAGFAIPTLAPNFLNSLRFSPRIGGTKVARRAPRPDMSRTHTTLWRAGIMQTQCTNQKKARSIKNCSATYTSASEPIVAAKSKPLANWGTNHNP
ncbi:hypothetical protein E2542_SST13279 [Spatholobus suberectus]|nr:hypothetical protein E2542_SST13279 [Spatholobus suberectus]